MVRIAKLTADLVTQTSQFESGLKRANNSLLQSKQIMTTAIGSIDTSFKKLGVTIGGFFAARKLLGDVRKMVDYLDDVGDAAQRIGISTEAFSKLRYAAKVAEVPLENLEQIISKMQKNLVAASSDSNNKVAVALRTIGLEAENLRRVGADEALAQIADGLNKVTDPALKFSLASDILGNKVRSVSDLLNKGGAAIRQYGADAEKAGIVVTKEMADRAEEFKKSITEIEAQYQGLIIELTKEGAFDAGIAAVKGFSEVLLTIVTSIQAIRKEWRRLYGDLDKNNPEDLQLMIETQSEKVADGRKRTGLGRFAENLDRKVFGKSPNDIEKEKLDNLINLQIQQNQAAKQEEEAAKKKETADQKEIENNNKKLQQEYQAQQNAEKKGKTFESILTNLQKESEELGLQVELYGQKEGVQDRATRNAEINRQIQEAGIRLTREQQAQVTKYLDSIEQQKNKLQDLDEAQKDLAEKDRMRAQALTELGYAFESSFEDAILSGKKLSDVLDGLLQDILKILIRTQITQPFSSFVTGQSSGGGLFSLLKGFLPSFAVGSDYVPHDMTANIHKGERILTAEENRAFTAGMGTSGGVVVNVTNNSASNVSTSSSNGPNGTELNILIDQAVADNIQRPGSRTNQAMNAYKSRTLVRR